MKKRIFALLLILMFTLVSFTACGGKDSDDKESNVKQELVVGVGADTNSPKFKEIGVLSPNTNIYESLTIMNDNFQVKPGLATSWEYIQNNTWRFKIRENVKFHNGEELTADSVKYTYDQAMRTSGKSMLGLKEVKVVDKLTVDITTDKANMLVPEIITHPLYGIRCKGTSPDQKPIGTGPFKFESYEKDKQLVVTKNDAYWGTKAKLDKITFKYIADDNSRVMALQSGEVDVIKAIPKEMINQIKSKSYKIVKSSPGGTYVVFEVRVAGKQQDNVLSDVNVRKAIATAIDKKAIVDNAWDGYAEVNNTWMPDGMLGSSKSLIKGYDFNLDAAKKLLDDAGYKAGADGIRAKDGKALKITIVSGFPNATALKPIPEVVQQQLKKVGIVADIKEVSDDGVYEQMLKSGEGALWLTKGNNNNADPTMGAQMMHQSTGYYGKDFGNPWWGGEKYDNQIDDARNTTDLQQRQKLMAEAMKNLIDEQSSLIPIASQNNIYATNNKVSGLMPAPADVHTVWTKVYKTK